MIRNNTIENIKQKIAEISGKQLKNVLFCEKKVKKSTFQNFEIRKKFSKKNFGVQKKTPPPSFLDFLGSFRQ